MPPLSWAGKGSEAQDGGGAQRGGADAPTRTRVKKRHSLDPRAHGEFIEGYRDATTPLDEVTATFLVHLRLLRAQDKLAVLMPLLSDVVPVVGSLKAAAASMERLLLAGFLAIKNRRGHLSVCRGPIRLPRGI